MAKLLTPGINTGMPSQPTTSDAMEITISFDASVVPLTAAIANLQATIEKLYAKLKLSWNKPAMKLKLYVSPWSPG